MAVLDLLDYRRRVAESYRRVRANSDPHAAWMQWVEDRRELFATHPQSPWEEHERTTRELRYFPYDPAWRFTVEVIPSEHLPTALGHSATGSTAAVALGTVSLPLAHPVSLVIHWLSGYGGGLFLAFRDRTSGTTTYQGGRYLLDSTKGADLGGDQATLVLDFNFAYHPSCVHSVRWSCPLPPAANHVPVLIEAGERLP